MKPVVLLVTSCRWLSTARIAIAFSEAGCDVDIVCPGNHPASSAHVVHRFFAYHGLYPSVSIQKAIEISRPRLIVPCDDRATIDLIDLATLSGQPFIREAVQQSIGSPDIYAALISRSTLMQIARDAGVCVPETMEIPDVATLRKWISLHGLPAYLKLDGVSGGVGVQQLCDESNAEQVFRVLSSRLAFVRVLKRLIVDRDAHSLRSFMMRTRAIVNAQKTMKGVETTSAIACWKGCVLSGVHAEVLERMENAGHSTVVRIIDNQQMQNAAEKIAKRLNLSGLYGLDYIIDHETGQAFLIEMNPRATQTCHLTLGPGQSPIAALSAVITGASFVGSPKVTTPQTIALFPQEWKRDPSSPYLRSALLDVPRAYPDLVRLGLKKNLRELNVFSYSKWIQRLDVLRRRNKSRQ